MSPSFAGSGLTGPSFVCSVVFIAEAGDGIGDEGWEISQQLMYTHCWMSF